MPKKSRWFPRLSVLLLVLAAAASARASGRHVNTTAIVTDPHDPSTLYARLSSGYGLVATRDAGASWRWICGRAIGTIQTDDPTVVVTPNGTLVLATLAGVAVSRDRGCSFSFVGGRDALPLTHLAMRPDGQLVGVSASGDNPLVISDDDAQTFTRTAGPRDRTVVIERTAVAPSDRARLYLTGVRGDHEARTAAFFVSYDGGRSWLERTAEGAFEQAGILEATVDPDNADRVFVRTELSASGARVLVTEDAGRTWKKVFVTPTWIHDLALSGDGARVFLASYDGLMAAPTDTFAFVQANPTPTTCVALTSRTLWACGTGAAATFDLGSSANRGTDFLRTLRWKDLQGPLDCPAGSDVAKACRGEWPFSRSTGLPDPAQAVQTAAPSPRDDENTRGSRRSPGTFLALALGGLASYLVLRRRHRH